MRIPKGKSVNKEFIRIQAEINEDDSKIIALGSSINDLNAETDEIKQSLREQKKPVKFGK